MNGTVDLLCTLGELSGPSGQEGAVRSFLRARCAEWGLPSPHEDALGSLYVSLGAPGAPGAPAGTRAETRVGREAGGPLGEGDGGAAAPGAGAGPAAGAVRLLLLVPMDEPGVVVTHLDARGRAWVAALGALPASAWLGRPVRLASGQRAVVARRSGGEGPPAFDELYLDFGFRRRSEAQGCICVGEAAVADVPTRPLAGGVVCGRALGTRAACAAALLALGRAAGCTAPAAAVTVAFLAQSEVGQRGVRPAVARHPAQLIVSLGAAAAGEAPGAQGARVRLGGGPVLVVQDRGLIASAPALDALGGAAACAGVRLQVAVADPGTTAAGPALVAAAGVPAGALGVPLRYRHSGAELCDPRDVDGAAAVVARLLRGSPAGRPRSDAAERAP